MEMNYTPIPHEFLEEMAELSDAEYGRLVRWGQEYMIRGVMTELSGNERFFAKRMLAQLDRVQAEYDAKEAKKSAAARVAGRASAEKRRSTTVNDRQRTLTTVNDRQRPLTTVATPAPPTEPDLSAFGPDLKNAIQEWLQYKKERKEPYTKIGLKKLLNQIRNYADRYGEPALVALIAECEASNYQGIIFDKLGRTRPAQGGGKDRRVANYDYTETEDCL